MVQENKQLRKKEERAKHSKLDVIFTLPELVQRRGLAFASERKHSRAGLAKSNGFW